MSTINVTGGINGASLSKAYNIPANSGTKPDGTKVKVGIISPLGGGFLQSDINKSMSDLGLPSPTINFVSINSATNNFNNDPLGSNGEIALDIFCIASMVPNAIINCYISPSTVNFFNGLQDCVKQAIVDDCDVITISYGSNVDQSVYSQYLQSIETSLLATAITKNITICVASGDWGSSALGSPYQAELASYPSSSPSVISVGGTNLILNTDNTRKYESYYKDYRGVAGGGGISNVFTAPSWQQGLTYRTYPDGVTHKLTMRGIPDVSMAFNNYNFYLGGKPITEIGTSASCPSFAGMIARFIGISGKRPQNLHQVIYSNPGAFNDVTTNLDEDATIVPGGYYGSATGWDPLIGMGVPDGQLLYNALYPTPSLKVKDQSGNWQNIKKIYAKDTNNAWQPVKAIWTKTVTGWQKIQSP